jgi:hypothetical protein
MDAIDFDFIICQHSAILWSKRSDAHLTLIGGCFLVILQIDLEDELTVLVSDLHIAWLWILDLHEMHGAHTRIHKVLLHASWLVTPRLLRQLGSLWLDRWDVARSIVWFPWLRPRRFIEDLGRPIQLDLNLVALFLQRVHSANLNHMTLWVLPCALSLHVHAWVGWLGWYFSHLLGLIDGLNPGQSWLTCTLVGLCIR